MLQRARRMKGDAQRLTLARASASAARSASVCEASSWPISRASSLTRAARSA
jgi:hypothetical protein